MLIARPLGLPFDHFDVIARWYERFIRRPAGDPLARLVDARPGQLVLDVGGGTGRNVGGLRSVPVRAIVLDSSRQMLGQASRHGLDVALGSATSLPFADQCADRVLVVDAFHHFVSPSPEIAQAAAAAELVRVLKHGGLLVVEEPNIALRRVRMVALAERVLLMGSRFLAPQALVESLERAGARLVASECDSFSVRLLFGRS